ncbi:BapA/Bap/LapF family large adhesin [Sphingomonas sp. CFBP 13720]|uniref:BapA/Bap/LapF family large adhesin n=1 Tax=Sphingomonas sp. CFBP 13720 TaxID=2775302 RepID=UPI00177E52EC|nr:BapA/Bap/LapF family large adhesin [Sphingomonas sp. CFBP 13720]MBD8679148.1 BapA prefix-like domain-containing protein [Sphingomonas sp. CFBP 13720]
MDVEVISKTSGAVNIVSTDAIELNGASIVQLRVERSAIAAFERQGDDLILRMAGGEMIRIPRFYVLHQGGDSDLVLIERDGGKWLAQSGSGVPRFVPLEEIDPLLAVGGPGGGGSGLLIPALAVGGAATGVGVGVAASGGGGGGNDGNGGNDGGSTPPDTIAPSAPTATITANGSGVSGVGEAGATVQVRSTAGAVVATGTVGADGNYAVALTPPRITGEPLSVIQTDAAGNASVPTTVTAPDLVAPTAPAATVSDDGAQVTGQGEPGARIEVRDAAGTVIGTAVAAADGSFAVALTTPQTAGGSLTIVQADAAGNVSAPVTLATSDLTAPDAPVVTLSPDGATVGGTGEPGATVRVIDGRGTMIATGTVGADGGILVALVPPANDGGTLTVVQIDAAGNVSAPVTLATSDLTAPDAPVVTLSPDGATVGGTGEPGATVRVIDGAGTTIATGTVGADGGILVALVPPANDGGSLTIVQADAAGNVSAPVTLATPDLTAPGAPVVTLSSDGSSVGGTGEPGATVRVIDGAGMTIATGTVGADGGILVALVPPANDGGTLTVVQIDAGGNASPAATLVTPDATAPASPVAQVAPDGLTVSGTGEAGATVTVAAPAGAIIGTALVGTDGSYVVRIAPAQIDGEALRVVQTDPAGNASDPVTVAAPDLTAPDAPAVVLAPDGASISGTGEPGATVTATTPAGVPIGSGIVADDGSFVVTLNPAQANGETFAVAQTDRSGNSSPSVTLTAPDITAPGAPVAQVDADGISVAGTGEPGAIVRIHDPADVEIGSATVRADGTYLAPLNPPQTNGEALSVVQVDDAGNVSVAVVTVAPDFTMPAAPTAAINGDGTSVTGTGEAGATLNVTDTDGTIVGTATVAADGTYLAPLTPPQADGQALSVVQRDTAGNASPAIPLVAPDITAPVAPAATIDPTGTVVTGSGEPGAAIVVRSADGTTIGVGTADARGAFAVPVTPSLIDGQTLSVVQADAAGNVSPATPLTAPDLTAPAAPVAAVSPDGASVVGTGDPGATVSVTDPLGVAIGSGVVAPDGSYAVTLVPAQIDGEAVEVVQTDVAGNVSPPAVAIAPDLVPDTGPDAPTALFAPDGTAVSGTAEAFAAITARDATGAVIATGSAAADGSYTLPIAPPRIDGETVRVTQTDADGLVSAPSTAFAPDLTAPSAPTATLDASGTVVTGTGERGSAITIRADDGSVLGTATVNARGSYVALLTSAQRDGETLSVVQTDRAGNASSPLFLTAADVTAPPAPLATVDATGATVTGTGEPGATVRVSGPGGVPLGSALVAVDGSYVVPIAPAQANGQPLTVVQVDTAGNVSPATGALAPDLTAPATPSAIVSVDGTAVSGVGERGAVVVVTAGDGTLLGSSTVRPNGSYTVLLQTPQIDGETLSVVQRDAAGNTSAPATPIAPDYVAPPAPVATVAPDGAAVTGTGEAGAIVTVRDADGDVLGSATVLPDGSFTVPLTPRQANGEALSAVQADAAGNASPVVPLIAPDITAPTAPVAAVAQDGTAVTGTGEAGATVTVRDADGDVLGSATVLPDGSFTVPLTPRQANGEALSVVQSDAAGNASLVVPLIAPDITAPAAPVAAVAQDGTAVTGTGEAGAIVTVRDVDGDPLASVVVGADGSFVVPLTPRQANGEALSVVQVDATGNASPVVPLTAPDITAPTAPTLTIGPDGASAAGTGEPGAAITITDPQGAVIGTATVDPDGNYTTPLIPAKVDGERLTAVQADGTGNASAGVTAVAPDFTAPPAPTATVSGDGTQVTGTGQPGGTILIADATGATIAIATVQPGGNYVATLDPPRANGEVLTVTQSDAAGNLSPAIDIDAPDITAPAALDAVIATDGSGVSGTGEPEAVVTIVAEDGTLLGGVAVEPDGSFAFPFVPPLVEGEVLRLSQTDAGGNESSPVTLVAPDLTAPGAPLASIDATGSVVTGVGEAGATITVSTATGTIVGTATAAADGSFTVPLTPPQANGGSLVVVQEDAAGNVSPDLPLIAPDITPPAIPVAAVAIGGTAATGTGEAGATVRVVGAGGVLLGAVQVATDGSFTVPLTPAQADGQPLAVVQEDRAGNLSPTLSLTAPDITPPPAPTIQIVGNGAVATGIGEPGARVTITDAAGTVLGSATVRAGGGYVVPLSPPQTDGEILRAIQVDRAGNPSPPGIAIAPDMTAPLVPTATVSADGATVSGTGVSGGRITVTGPDGTIIGTAVADGNGAYVAPLSPAQGNGEVLNVVQADGAGNVSSPVPVVAPDFTAPAAPVAALDANGAIVTGSGEPGARISVTNAAGVEIGTAIVRADGDYAVALSPPQANGEVLSVTQTDGAGNPSLPTGLQALDVTAPPPPAGLTVAPDGTSVSGQGEAGATVVVRDSAGTVLGSAVVAGDGRFVVPLAVGQTDGDTLSVRQTDGAGNQSGPALVVAPFDIVAFDNADAAGIDLLAPTTSVDFGGAAYVLLTSVGLLNLQAEVLGTPAVRFSVDPGHSLGAVFTYGAVADITALAGYSVVVQRFDGTRWVAADGPGSTSVLRLNLLNGDLVATDSFGPGEYRAFLAYSGTVGLGLLGTLAVRGTDTDFTQVSAAVPQATDGNFITDANAGGDVDSASPQTSVQSVTVNGVTTAIAADGTVVDGAWGTLIVDRDGSYTYTPDANPAAIGRTETIGYTLFDASDGETATATLSIAIGSPDIAAAPTAANDFAVVAVDYVNVETSIAPAQEFSFLTPTAVLVSRTASGADTFTVATNTTSDVTIIAARSGLLAVLPSYTIVVTDSRGTEVGRVTQTSAANLLGSGATLTIPDLPAGTYSYTVSSTNFVGTGYGTTVYISEVVTHLDRFVATDIGTVDGNVFDNDAAGSAFATLRIGNAAIGDPVTIAGTYGTLTIDGTGSYSYQPAAGLPYSTSDLVDRFTYQIVQPNGAVAEATLAITIDVPGVGGFGRLAADAIALDDDMLAGLAVDDLDGADLPTVDADLLFAEFEGQGTPEDVLTRYLDEPMDGEQAGQMTGVDMTGAVVFEPADPLDYLAAIDEQDRNGALHHPVL